MTRIAPIPLRISEVLLPEDSLNVVDLSTFPVPSDRSAPKLLALTDDMLFSETVNAVKLFQKIEPFKSATSSGRARPSLDTAKSASKPTDTKKQQLKKQPTLRKNEAKGKGKADNSRTMNQFFSASEAALPNADVEMGTMDNGQEEFDWAEDGEDGDDDSDGGNASEESEGRDAAFEAALIDISIKRKKEGRKPDSLMDEILQPCYHPSKPYKRLQRCKGCRKSYSNRNRKRTFGHARNCHKLPDDLRMRVKARLAKKAPSRKLPATDPECTKPTPIGDAGGPNSEGEGKVVVVKKQKLNSGHPFFQEVKKLGKRERHQKLDLAVVKFFCVAGLPTYIADLDIWKELLITADPSYAPASRAKLEEEQIVSEAESIIELQTAYLQTQENITVSCDGGTTRGREAFWTVHMSTMGTIEKKRKVYLMAVREATSESHTGEWIKTLLLEIIDKIGRSRITALVCDSTGNTRLCRELIVKEIPTMFNLPDIVHFISNTLKDIVKLAHFQPTITTVRGVIKKFHKSHPGAAELKIVHSICSITKGLDAIGKTRFGTIVLAAWSVQINVPALQKIVERGIFDLEDLETYFDETTIESFKFKKALSQLIKVGSPALKALTCLESDEMNPGDVYIFWHAMLWATKEVLVDSKSDFPPDVQHQILGILNARHSQIFEDGNLATAADLYLAGAYLNPMYLTSDLFRRETDNSSPDFEGILHVPTFKKVAQFLVATSEKEILHGDKQELTKWRGRAGEFKKKLLDEMKKYARRQFPFNTPVDENFGIIAWWQALRGNEFAEILPILAIKIFSVRVNSMAEERTVSTFTWMTPALRANLSVGQMTAKTIVRQHYATEKKARKNSRPRPTVKFYDVKSKIFRTSDTADSQKALDDEDDSWLDESPESHPLAQSLIAETDKSSPVNLQSSLLATFLVDEKAKAGGNKVAVSKPKPAPAPGNGHSRQVDDNDFSMLFD